MARSVKEIESMARNWSEKMLNVLTGIACCEDAPHASRVAAANIVLDRGWGKPAQAIVGDNDADPINILQRIERVVVDPANKDSEEVPPAS